VRVDLGDTQPIREHRCGDGFAAQHSATMIVGLGARATARSVSVLWPSGRATTTQDVPEGTLLVVHENPADSPSGEAWVRLPYRIPPALRPASVAERPIFPLAAGDRGRRPNSRLCVYTTFATWCPSCKKQLPVLQHLHDEFAKEGVEFISVPIDGGDDDKKLSEFARDWRPPSRLAAIDATQRPQANAAFGQALGHDPVLPCSVITDSAGHLLAAQPGVPSVSSLRQLLEANPRSGE
jgi:thiol-disulfide isomerase/thioredoxin